MNLDFITLKERSGGERETQWEKEMPLNKQKIIKVSK